MTKEEWHNLYKKLHTIHSDFLMEYPEYKSGKNKKIRADAERKINHLLYLADFYIMNHGEAFIMLTKGEGVSDYGRTIIYDEFLSFRYFGGDMSDFLRKIQEKIQELNDE